MTEGELFDGKYRILRTLGRGGMSTVYLAENVKLGTLWAIKKITKKPGSKIDIYVEPNILKRLNHPFLPRIFDITEDEDHFYTIVDYIEGTSLDKELQKTGRFPEKVVVQWARQICDVLNYLHTFKPNPIIYRDMKPSNIILTKEGTIKLIDFGIAREYKTGADSDTIYIGTRGYAAPEQYGSGQTSPATDVYSLGVTLYHLLTGKNPNDPPYEIKPVRLFDPDLSIGIEQIIARSTRQNPEERYPSVQEMLKDLDQMDKGGLRIREHIGAASCILPKGNYVSFKKLVLAIWSNAEFACELAYAAAKLTGFKILLMDLDFVSSNIDLYITC